MSAERLRRDPAANVAGGAALLAAAQKQLGRPLSSDPADWYGAVARFSGADDFFKPRDDIEPDPIRGLAMRRTNLIPDIVNTELPLDNRRSPGYRRVEPAMAGNRFYLWIGQHETGRYSKAHAHTSAAVLICLTGKGYTYTWPERNGVTPWKDGKESEVKRVDYEPFGMVSAAPGGARWYHQHFGVGEEGFRLTAWFGPHNPGRDPGAPGETGSEEPGQSSAAVAPDEAQPAAARTAVRGVTDDAIRLGIGVLDIGALRHLGPAFDNGDGVEQMNAWLEGARADGLLPIHGRDLEFTFRRHQPAQIDAASQRASCQGFVADDRVFAVLAGSQYQIGSECVAGESPNYSPETVETAWLAIKQWIAPRVLGHAFEGPERVFPALEQDFRGHRMAKAAVEMGAWALSATRAGQSLSRCLGGTRDEIATGISIGI